MLAASESKPQEWRANLTDDRMEDPGCRTQNGGPRMEDPVCRTQDGGPNMQDPGSSRTQDPGDDGCRPWTED